MSGPDIVAASTSSAIIALPTLSPPTLPSPAAFASYTDHVIDTGALSLKRRADSELDIIDSNSNRKRIKENMDAAGGTSAATEGLHVIDGHALADDLAQELQCGCCSEVVYKPVVVAPCEHFFCGRYVLHPL